MPPGTITLFHSPTHTYMQVMPVRRDGGMVGRSNLLRPVDKSKLTSDLQQVCAIVCLCPTCPYASPWWVHLACGRGRHHHGQGADDDERVSCVRVRLAIIVTLTPVLNHVALVVMPRTIESKTSGSANFARSSTTLATLSSVR